MIPSDKAIFPLLAKVGHKVHGDRDEQARTLWQHYYDKDIETYEQKRLSTITEVLFAENPIDDVVMLTEVKKYGLDYDYKREVLSDGSTKAFNSVDDVKLYRGVVQTLRGKKGLRATPELVHYYANRSKQNVRSRGSATGDCIRHFIRALVQGVSPFKREVPKYSFIVNRFRGTKVNITVNMLKNAKRRPFVANVIFNSTSNRKLIRFMLERLGYESDDNYSAWLELLMNRGLSNPVTMFE